MRNQKEVGNRLISMGTAVVVLVLLFLAVFGDILVRECSAGWMWSCGLLYPTPIP